MSSWVRENRGARYLVRAVQCWVGVVAVILGLAHAQPCSAYQPWWVQNHMEAQLWSGPDAGAVSFGVVSQWSYFLVVEPQGREARLHVWNPETNNYAYIDAKAVGPSGPPPQHGGSRAAAGSAGEPKAAVGETAPFAAWWGETQVAADLWSGADSHAVSFGQLPRGSRVLVVMPEKDSRYYVFNPDTGNYAYVDAAAVVAAARSAGKQPEETQGAAETRPARRVPRLESGYQGWWVANFLETELWGAPGPDSASLGRVPQFRRFMVIEPQQGSRLRVWYPEKDVFGYVDAAAVGPCSPSAWVEAHPVHEVENVGLPGRSVGEKPFIRNLPVYDDETEVRRLPNNTPVEVKKAVTSADGNEWYVVGDGEYILATEVRLPRDVAAVTTGRWIDVDLDEPAMVTAYEGNKVVYTTLAIKGTRNTPTPVGTFSILRRVRNETMDSETIGIPRDGPGGYLLKNVLYTQYFTPDGASLHYNYWTGTFGYAGSHGCLGLSLEDSRWLWDWAEVGTPVVVRSRCGGTWTVVRGSGGPAVDGGGSRACLSVSP